VVECPEYRRTDLGGRSGVFAVEDARGALSTALIFKPVASEVAGEREAANMNLLRNEVKAQGKEDRFGVPLSLEIVAKDDGEFVHVMERQLGRLLSFLPVREASGHLPACAELLGIFHSACDAVPPGRSGWPALKNGLRLWSSALFEDDSTRSTFVESFKATLPNHIPLVQKRDAHAGNWVIDSANRVIAIDLEASSIVPAGCDVAQLVEDGALLPVTIGGFELRYELMANYLSAAGIALDEAADVVYDWFALYRAVWLATSAGATKSQHSHARLLSGHIARHCSHAGIRDVAELVLQSIQKVGATAHDAEGVSPAHRRLSRAMARMLRHRAHEHGLVPDDAGFVPLAQLCLALGRSGEDVMAVASHPAEPRFQVVDDAIRALYGHSFPVADQHEINVELPIVLYHGTSWDSLGDIVADGLRPMSRERVHLTNNPAEAIEVARRHRQAILLAVDTQQAGDLRAVADAV
jgi:RNA:NAD 2'-phosphotransferase (TPT1/KptA family)